MSEAKTLLRSHRNNLFMIIGKKTQVWYKFKDVRLKKITISIHTASHLTRSRIIYTSYTNLHAFKQLTNLILGSSLWNGINSNISQAQELQGFNYISYLFLAYSIHYIFCPLYLPLSSYLAMLFELFEKEPREISTWGGKNNERKDISQNRLF